MPKNILMKNLLVLLFLLTTPLCQAQGNETAVPFLLIVPDARSAGMGDNGIASSYDVFSNYHNAAKNVFTEEKNELGIFYVPWMNSIVKDVFLSGGSYVHKINERSVYGFGLNYFTLGNLDLTDDNGASLGSERPSDLSIDFNYGLKLGPRFSMGVGLKYIRSDLGLNSSDSDITTINTGAIDVSSFYQSLPVRYGSKEVIYRAGVVVKNFGPNVETSEGGNTQPLPTTIGAGFGTELFFNPQNSLTLNLEYEQLIRTEQGGSYDHTYSFGFEYGFDETFFLRSGYFDEIDPEGSRQYLTFGTGFVSNSVAFDLSYLFNQSQLNNALDNTLRMSLTFAFGGNKS